MTKTRCEFIFVARADQIYEIRFIELEEIGPKFLLRSVID